MLLDDVLKEIGEFGVYQIILYCLLGLTGIPTACQNMGIVLVGASMEHWCKIPRLANFSFDQQKYIGIPYDGDSSQTYSQCLTYDLNWDNLTDDDLYQWNRTNMVDSNTPTKQCSDWEFDRSEFVDTVVSSMKLVCRKSGWVSNIQTVYMAGFLTGCVVFGQFSDRQGRKVAILVSLTLETTTAFTSSFISNYYGYVVLRFFIAMGAAGSFTTIFVMSMEIIGGKYRTPTGIMIQAWFSLGIMIYSFIGFYIRDHQIFERVLSLYPLALIGYVIVLPESPRWLISMGRDEEAIKVLEKIAVVNGKELPPNLDLSDNRQATENDNGKKPIITDLLKTPNMRKITLIMCFLWFTCSLVYYGLSLGVDVLGGSIFLNSFISGLIEVPGLIISFLVLDKFGRRWPTIITYILTGGFCLLCIPFLSEGSSEAALSTFLMLGKSVTAGTFAIVYVYAAEVFPTVVRNVGVGASSMSARIGGLIQPQLMRLDSVWVPFPFAIYGAMSALAGIAGFFLPETMGKQLPNSMEEGEQFGKKPLEAKVGVLEGPDVEAIKHTSQANGANPVDNDIPHVQVKTNDTTSDTEL